MEYHLSNRLWKREKLRFTERFTTTVDCSPACRTCLTPTSKWKLSFWELHHSQEGLSKQVEIPTFPSLIVSFDSNWICLHQLTSKIAGKDVELQLVKAGVHVFCEKPVTALFPENFSTYCQAVSKIVEEKELVFSVGYMFRFVISSKFSLTLTVCQLFSHNNFSRNFPFCRYHAAVTKMKQLIEQHGGKIMSLEARFHFAFGNVWIPHWWDVSKSGGPVVEQATHLCDVARFLAGEIDESTVHTVC